MTPSLRLRLRLWYISNIGALVCVPYLAVLLDSYGLSATQLTLVLSLIPVGLLLGGPSWAALADWQQASGPVLRAATLAQACAGVGLVLAQDALQMSLAILCFALARAPQAALADSLTLELLGSERRHYGSYRAWGSLAYLVAAFASGWLRESWPRAPLWVAAALMLGCAVVSLSLPSGAATPQRPTLGQLRALLARPSLRLLLAAAVLHGATLSAYDNLFSLHVEGLGLGAGVVGSGIALGVGVEVAVLALGARLLRRFGPGRLLVVAMALGVPRWGLTALLSAAPALILTQSLHGVMFGAFWLAGVALLNEHAPPGLARSAQSLLPAAAFGLGYLLAMLGGSLVIGEVGTRGLFGLGAGVSGLATLLAWATARRLSAERRAQADPGSAAA